MNVHADSLMFCHISKVYYPDSDLLIEEATDAHAYKTLTYAL